MSERARILVVDDAPNSVRVIQDVLAAEGYQVIGVGSGAEAMEKAQGGFCNVALLDIRLPDVEGIELIAPLKEMLPDMAVIMVTAYASLETAVRALNQGASAYVTKPLDMDQVLAIVREALEKQQLVMENRRLLQEAKQREREAQSLYDLTRLLTSLDYQQIIASLVGQSARMIDCHVASFLLAKTGSANITLKVIEPVSEGFLQELQQRLLGGYETLSGQKTDMVTVDLQGKVEAVEEDEGETVESFLIAPLIAGGKVLGMLNLSSPRSNAYTESDLRLLSTVSNQAALAIENARLFQAVQRELVERKRAEEELKDNLERLRKTLGGTIKAIASTVEIRDPYTAGHQRRVANLARAIATEMGLSKDQIDGIRMAGVTHDIGKISIPAEILSKPIKLNALEIGLIREHPQIAYNVLKEIDFPWPVADIVLQHHERTDGSGYPQGLSGDEIILEARILAVADVVEAMASFRPYRPARGLDKALEEISQNRGVLYDAEVVDVCLKLFAEEKFKFEWRGENNV